MQLFQAVSQTNQKQKFQYLQSGGGEGGDQAFTGVEVAAAGAGLEAMENEVVPENANDTHADAEPEVIRLIDMVHPNIRDPIVTIPMRRSSDYFKRSRQKNYILCGHVR